MHVRSEVPLPIGAGDAAVPAEVPGGADLDAVRSALAARGRESDLQLRDGLVVEETLDAFEAGAFHLLVDRRPRRGLARLRPRGPHGAPPARLPGSTLIVPR